MADLGPHLARLLPRLGGQLADGGRKALLERLQGDLEQLGGRFRQLVHLVEALGDAAADVADGLVQREVAGKLVGQIDPVHLKALVTEHAQPDGDVGDVAGQVGDALGHGVHGGGDIGHEGTSRGF